ncbi:MAG: hypothetical protein QMD85_02505 [Candidatus Aenigmarchaeota archaeon]|nr:hypothetical protein [Candidatus Aenigmarchaeota archaeon]MDI6722415.1 hypothetical protein [Candidatus Aenigmarchaeota archaeon]
MKLQCPHCSHNWMTRKDKIPSACPHCKYSTYYHKPIVVKK